MPLAATQPPELQLARRSSHLGCWLMLWLSLILLEILLLAANARLDTLAWSATRWFVGDREGYNWVEYHAARAQDSVAHFYTLWDPPLQSHFFKHTQHLWEVCRSFGEPWMTLVIILLISTYHSRRWRAGLMALIATLSAGGLGALIRIVTGRTRPTHIDGENLWQFCRGFHDSHDLSFPSGHATVAFATAAVLASLSPRGKWIFIPLAAGCAISRVVMGAHFWSDVLLGSVLGWSIGWWLTWLLGGRIIGPQPAAPKTEHST